MKVKAVIARPDRTNDVIVLRNKDIQGKTFRHGDNTYFLHPDRFMITWTKPGLGLGLIKRYSRTFYYTQGHSQPLPFPDFNGILLNGRKNATEAEKQSLKEAVLAAKNGHPTTDAMGYSGIMDNGISGEELAAIFNPWFYRIIAQKEVSIFEQLQFWLTAGTLCAVLYLIYALTTGHYELPPVVPTQ